MLDDFLENLFQEIEEEPFEIDEALLDMGISGDQQLAIYEAKKEVLNQYNALKNYNNKNYIRIKKEIEKKLGEIESEKETLLAENIELKKTIEELKIKVNLSLSHRAGEGLINQLKESEKLTKTLADRLYSRYKFSKVPASPEEKLQIKKALADYINYSNYYLEK
jgi:hypothetical protein